VVTSGTIPALVVSAGGPSLPAGNFVNLVAGSGQPVGQVTILLVGAASSTFTTRTARADNVSLTVTVPEPSTVMLLGLGCAALAARRRKRSLR